MRSYLLLALVVAASWGSTAALEPDTTAADNVDGADGAEGSADDGVAEAVEDIAESIPEEAIDEPAEPAAEAKAAGKASVQWTITQKMQAQLTKLGYNEADIASLDADRAAAIIRRSIAKPGSGVPRSWNRSGSRKAVGGGLLATVGKPFAMVGVPAGPAAVLSAVLLGSLGVAGFGLLPMGAIVKRATADTPTALPVDVAESDAVSMPSSSDDLWLDVQIDRFIAFLKKLVLGKK